MSPTKVNQSNSTSNSSSAGPKAKKQKKSSKTKLRYSDLTPAQVNDMVAAVFMRAFNAADNPLGVRTVEQWDEQEDYKVALNKLMTDKDLIKSKDGATAVSPSDLFKFLLKETITQSGNVQTKYKSVGLGPDLYDDIYNAVVSYYKDGPPANSRYPQTAGDKSKIEMLKRGFVKIYGTPATIDEGEDVAGPNINQGDPIYPSAGTRQGAGKAGMGSTSASTNRNVDSDPIPTVESFAKNKFKSMIGETYGDILGYNPLTGQARGSGEFSRYRPMRLGTMNPGGGMTDTEVTSSGPGKSTRDPYTGSRVQGDVVTRGAMTVPTATKTLRSKMAIADPGYEAVRTSPYETLQNDVLFEAFSWVPEGFGLGPNNALHQLNKAHDALRYGMEQLYQPRADSPSNPPHGQQPAWQNSMPVPAIMGEFENRVRKKVSKLLVKRKAESTPVVRLDDEYNLLPSSKALPRNVRGPSLLQPVTNNLRIMKDRFPSAPALSSRRMRGTLRGTWNDFM